MDINPILDLWVYFGLYKIVHRMQQIKKVNLFCNRSCVLDDPVNPDEDDDFTLTSNSQ